MMRLVVIAVSLVIGVVRADSASGTPIEKVLEMMNDLMAKAAKEKADEAKAFDKFKTWCHETERDKGFAIDDGNKAIGRLTSDVEKHKSDAKDLGEEIAQLNTEIDAAEEQKRKATELREEKHANYEATHEELTSGLVAVETGLRRINRMMKQTGGAAASASFVQSMAEHPQLPEFARAAMASFLMTSDSEAGDFGTPEAAAFESQSGGVVELFEDLEKKMSDQKRECENREIREQNAFNLMETDLKNQIKGDTQNRNSKASAMKESEALAAQASGDLAETTLAKEEDEKYVRDMKMLCKQKATDFAARQKMREEELEAITNAMEIISSGEVAGAGGKHLPGLVQQKAAKATMALAQLRSGRQPSDTQAAAASFLESQAGRLGSRQLAALAVRASADPFVKVRSMIEGMIQKLQDEASEEADHKGWCDEELSTNEHTRTEKTTRIAELKASIEEMEAEVSKLGNDITNLRQGVAELDEAVAEATKNREEEKAKNTATISDAKVAMKAIARAMQVLKDFYTKAGGATALLQDTKKPLDASFQAAHAKLVGSRNSLAKMEAAMRASEQHAETVTKAKAMTQVSGPADDMPETFDAPFQGSGGEGGILSMMEVIMSDFERLEAETSTGEAVAAKEYKDFMADSTADRESTEKERVAKESRVSKTKHEIRVANKDLKSTTEELEGAQDYYDKLKPSCVDSGVSYEDRVKARKEEIASLQEALKILLEA